MSDLKTNATVLDAIRQRLSKVDRSKSSYDFVLLLHLRQENRIVKSIVLDFNSLQQIELPAGAAGSDQYPADGFKATMTIDDDDFFSVATKQQTLAQLIDQGKVTIDGDSDVLLRIDERFQKKM